MYFRAQMAIQFQLIAQRVQAWIRFESTICRKAAAMMLMTASGIFWLAGKKLKALKLASSVHRADYSSIADRLLTRRLSAITQSDRDWLEQHIIDTAAAPSADAFATDPARLLGTRALVLKSPSVDEKGVVVLDYNFTFPLFARWFDVRKIALRYYFVFEPSWSGFCDLDILCYLNYGFPVFVQTSEPRDAAFLRGIGHQLIPVSIAANWWVDSRVFYPINNLPKDADLIIVAGWSKFKRHADVFRELALQRSTGKVLSVILVGYSGGDLGRDRIIGLARYYGVEDQLEVHENISAQEVNKLYNRAKVNLVWSRREGFNRAIIEGFYAGTPGILWDGHNYGFHYPFINDQTGCFSKEQDLSRTLLHLVDNYGRYNSRSWVLNNMNCEQATEKLSSAIQEHARSTGEKWSTNLSVKVSHLNGMSYWDESQRTKYSDDYAYLRGSLRTRANG
jgi:glycosyltransferase involved in cell wall biosynthesis